jgi:hypothetical protein
MSFGLVIDPGRGQKVQVGVHPDLRQRRQPVLGTPTVFDLGSDQARLTFFLTAEVQGLERAHDYAAVFRRWRQWQQLLLERVRGWLQQMDRC